MAKQTTEMDMLEFLAQLQEQIRNMDPSKVEDDGDEPEDGDKIVGTMPDSLKKIYGILSLSYEGLRAQCQKSSRRAKAIVNDELQVEEGDPDLPRAREHRNYRERHQIISSIFWQAVRETFSELIFMNNREEYESLAVRNEFRIALVRRKRISSSFPMGMSMVLDEIFGGSSHRRRP